VAIVLITLVIGTSAAVMQVACDGVHVGNVSIPCRYIHSPSEIVNLTDVDYTINPLIQHLRKRKKWIWM
jgi:endoglucanase